MNRQPDIVQKKTESARNCNWSFLEVKNSLFLNVNVNVIMNVIAVFHGFQRFSHIARNPWKIRLFRLLLSLIYRSRTLQVLFPAPSETPCKSRGFAIFLPPKKGFEDNFEDNWLNPRFWLLEVRWDFLNEFWFFLALFYVYRKIIYAPNDE